MSPVAELYTEGITSVVPRLCVKDITSDALPVTVMVLAYFTAPPLSP